MDDARHFFPFLPVAFALGIAIYFVWPSEPGFYYLAVQPILLTDVFKNRLRPRLFMSNEHKSGFTLSRAYLMQTQCAFGT